MARAWKIGANHWTVHRADWINIGIIVVIFAFLLLLVPAGHNYSVTDDWSYTHSVEQGIRLNYRPSEWSMATAFSHVLWGTLFAWLFGVSFTVLTYSNLVMSVMGIILFYLLLRQLQIVPSYALLGAAVLLLNPMYIYLSYSYMTDVPFVTYTTAALLCYVIGIKKQGNAYSNRWLFAGSFFVSLAYLCRQLGVLLLVAIVIYLLWESRKAEQLKRIAVAIALPCIVFIAYTLWERSFHVTLPAYMQNLLRSEANNNLPAWIWTRAVHIISSTLLVGLILLPLLSVHLIKNKIRGVLTLIGAFAVIFYCVYLGSITDGGWAPHDQGNILDNTGLLMQQYNSAPLFNQSLWLIVCMVSAISISIYLVAVIAPMIRSKLIALHTSTDDPSPLAGSRRSIEGRPHNKLEARGTWRTWQIWQSSPKPQALVFLAGLLIFCVTNAFSFVTTDRYWLPAMPILIAGAIFTIGTADKVQTESQGKLRPAIYRWIVLGCTAIVSLIFQQDYMSHATARWTAGEQLLGEGISKLNIYTGIEWTGWYLSDEGFQYFSDTGNTGRTINPAEAILDPVYWVSDTPIKGYVEINRLSYTSFLRGGQGSVLILKRDKDASRKDP